MSSINTSAINTAYPVPGVNNSSQGFRDNFTSIKNNLNTAKTEIENLQNKVILKSALTQGGTLDNNMAGALISNASVKGFRQPMFNLGSSLSENLLIDVTKGDVQYGTITGDTYLSFAGWSPTNTLSSVQLNLSIDFSAGYTIYLPSTQYNAQTVIVNGMDPTVTLLENYGGSPAAGASVTVTNQITAPAGVTEIQLKFTTVNCGITLSVYPVNRSTVSSYLTLRAPGNIGAPGDLPGAICFDGYDLYVCIGPYDGSSIIWGKPGWNLVPAETA